MKSSIVVKVVSVFIYVYLLTFSLHSFAGLIDFETTAAGGKPTDNLVIDIDSYFVTDGVSVSFGFDTTGDGSTDSSGVFEKIGGGKEKGNSGFVSPFGSRYDIAATGYEKLLGDYFFRQEDSYEPFGTFHITYDSVGPVTAASGEIWDIDGNKKKNKTEQYHVEAFNGNISLASIYSPLGTSYGKKSLNGKPWAFGFNGLSNITRIEISFTGGKTKGIGLAFNNFSPIQDARLRATAIPEPSVLAIFSLTTIGLAFRRFNRRRR